MNLHNAARLLHGEVSGGRISCPGPGHSRWDRSLRVSFDDGGKVRVHSFAGDDWRACRDHVRGLLGLPAFQKQGQADAAQDKRAPQERLAEALAAWEKDLAERRADAELAARLWARAVDPGGTASAAYLARRKLELVEGMAGRLVRHLDECPRAGARAPAMLVRFEPIGHPAAFVPWGDPSPVTCVQRIFLDPTRPKGHDGKWLMGHPFGLPKPYRGHDGCIATDPPKPIQVMELSPDEEVATGLHLAEGFETGLASMMAGFQPLWSVYSERALERFPVLPGIEALTILADHDGAGLSAAQACAERWVRAGVECFIRWPKRLGHDYANEVSP